MNPVRAVLVTAAASATNIALSQTPVSATNLTLNGTAVSGGVATLDVARRVLVTYGVEASARTLTITGTNRDRNVITETLTIPSGAGGTINTLNDFLTVTSITPAGGGFSAALTVGTGAGTGGAVASTAWFERDWGQIGRLGVLVQVIAAGGGTFAFEVTWDDPNANNAIYPGFTPVGFAATVEPNSAIPPTPFPCPGPAFATSAPSTTIAWTGFSTSTFAPVDTPVFAYRLTQLTGGAANAILQVIETTGDRKDAF